MSEGIKLQDFFVSFCGTFKGLRYNSDVPPRMKFPNCSLCNDFNDFVSQTTLERVADGSFLVWLEVGKVNPPHLVIPITVEPSKPRMCHDERFLNCSIKDCPFSLKICLAMLVLVITKPLLTRRVGMTTSFHSPLVILFSGSNGKVGILSILPCRLGARHLPFNRLGSDLLYPFLRRTVFAVYR